jgi:hypothetical protein
MRIEDNNNTLDDELNADLDALAELQFAWQMCPLKPEWRRSRSERAEYQRLQREGEETNRRIAARIQSLPPGDELDNLVIRKVAAEMYVPMDEQERGAVYLLGWFVEDDLSYFYRKFAKKYQSELADWEHLRGWEDWGGWDSWFLPLRMCVIEKLVEGGFDWGDYRLARWWFAVYLQAARLHVEEGEASGKALAQWEKKRRRSLGYRLGVLWGYLNDLGTRCRRQK